MTRPLFVNGTKTPGHVVLVNKATITKLLGHKNWEFSDPSCARCGSKVPTDAKVARCLISSQALHFTVVMPCKAKTAQGLKMVDCGSTRARIRILITSRADEHAAG